MNNVLKSGNLGRLLSATSETVASTIKPLKKPVKDRHVTKLNVRPVVTKNYSWKKLLPYRDILVKHGIPVVLQVRYSHSDLKVPDFHDYRRDSTKDPSKKSEKTRDSRKAFTNFVIASGAITAAYVAKSACVMGVMFMAASADVLALAAIEIDLAEIPEGRNITFKWRGKPLFVKHRTQAEIEQEQSVSLSILRDPQHDSDRCANPEWLVVIGVCTHLGCVPLANTGEFPGGFYCPCHGSHYDASGRIRKGPAPLNLQVPEYKFVGDNRLLVG